MMPRWTCLFGLMLWLLTALPAAAAPKLVVTTTPLRPVSVADLDDSFEVLRRVIECSYDSLCAAARREDERRVLLEKTGGGVYLAACEIRNAGHPEVQGELRVYGQLKAGAADVALWFRLAFTVPGLPPSATTRRELDADFSWYGRWDGSRDWPNLTVYASGDGMIRTPPVDEREADMMAAARRVTMRTKVAGRNFVFRYPMSDFAKAFDECRNDLVPKIGKQLAQDLMALPASCTQGECL